MVSVASYRRTPPDAMLHPVKESGMTVPSLGYLVAGLTAALGAVVCFGPDAWSVVHALAAAASAAVAMLATAIAALVTSNWQADAQSRQAWAGLGLAPAHLNLAVEAAPAGDIDPRYLASVSDEALREVFRTYRAAAQVARSHRATTVAERALRNVVHLPSQAVLSWKCKRPAKEIASPFRLVANGDAWPGWPALTYPRAGRTASVVVLSGSKDAESLPEASVAANGADSTAATGCRGPPRVGARRSTVSANPVVQDDLGHRIPIGRAELDVIESYLERELRELLGAVAPTGDREDA
jgi:hypothetical protein